MIKQEYVYSDNLDLLEETREFMITSRNAVRERETEKQKKEPKKSKRQRDRE